MGTQMKCLGMSYDWRGRVPEADYRRSEVERDVEKQIAKENVQNAIEIENEKLKQTILVLG